MVAPRAARRLLDTVTGVLAGAAAGKAGYVQALFLCAGVLLAGGVVALIGIRPERDAAPG